MKFVRRYLAFSGLVFLLLLAAACISNKGSSKNRLETINLKTDNHDVILASAVDAAGNLYVAGYQNHNPDDFDANNERYGVEEPIKNSDRGMLVKYNAQGAQVWGKAFDWAVGRDRVYAIALAEGDVFIAGSSGENQASPTNQYQAVVARYRSSDGAEVWRKSLKELGSKYAVGKLLGEATDITSLRTGEARSLGVANGTVYFGGFYSSELGGQKVFIAALSSNGQVMDTSWVFGERIGFQWQSYDTLTVVSDGLYIGGSSGGREGVLLKLNLDGSRSTEWPTTVQGVGGAINHIIVDATGNLYLAGRAGPEQSSPAWVAKYNNTGTRQWQKSWDANSQFPNPGDETTNNYNYGQYPYHTSEAFAIALSGNKLYVAGRARGVLTNAGVVAGDTSKSAYIGELDLDGGLTKMEQFGGSVKDSVRTMSLDAQGNIYLAGFTSGQMKAGNLTGAANVGTKNRTDSFIVKKNSAGTWAAILN